MTKKSLVISAFGLWIASAVWSEAASADRKVEANEPVVISDDIMKRTTAVRSSTAAPANAPTAGSWTTGSGGFGHRAVGHGLRIGLR